MAALQRRQRRPAVPRVVAAAVAVSVVVVGLAATTTAAAAAAGRAAPRGAAAALARLPRSVCMDDGVGGCAEAIPVLPANPDGVLDAAERQADAADVDGVVWEDGGGSGSGGGGGGNGDRDRDRDALSVKMQAGGGGAGGVAGGGNRTRGGGGGAPACAALGAYCSAWRPCCAGGIDACVRDPMIGGGARHCAYEVGAFRGTTLAPKGRWDLRSPAFNAAVARLPAAGYDCVALVFYAFLPTLTSTALHYNYSSAGEPVSADPRSVVEAIRKVHAAGLCVVLKPHVAIETRQWRGEVAPSAAFFAAYSSWLLGWVEVAQATGVEAVAVGSEWKRVEADAAAWRRLLRAARRRYKGYLTYAVNWDNYRELRFADSLDFLSIDAYFEVAPPPAPWPARPTSHGYPTILAGWRRVARTMDGWRARTHPTKAVVFLEAGARSVVGAASYPWDSQTGTAVDAGEQARYYGAMHAAFAPYTWWRGAFTWEWLWGAALADGPAVRTGYSTQGKPAERVIRRWTAGETRRAFPLAARQQRGGGGEAPAATPHVVSQDAHVGGRAGGGEWSLRRLFPHPVAGLPGDGHSFVRDPLRNRECHERKRRRDGGGRRGGGNASGGGKARGGG